MAIASWEKVSNEGGVSTHRLQVEGGWLYRVTAREVGGMAVAFAPSPNTGKVGSVTAPVEPGEKTENVPRVDD